MAEFFIHKNLADNRKEIQAYIGSLERDLEKARRYLSAIIVTEHVFQAKECDREGTFNAYNQSPDENPYSQEASHD